MVRLEVEWKDAHGDTNVSDLLDRYTEGLVKEASKKKRPLQLERHVPLEGLQVQGVESAEHFAWANGIHVYALAGYSQASDRLLFLRVMGRPNEDLSSLLPTIFNSLTDTPRDSSKLWSLYDSRAISPAGYAIDTYELKSGHIRLRFAEGKRQLQFDRLSLGKSLLKNQSLAEWFDAFYQKDNRHSNLDVTETEWLACNAVEFTGSPKGKLRALLQPLPFWNTQPALFFSGRAWFNEETNKIHVVKALWKNGVEPPDLDAACRSVVSGEPDAQPLEV
jgi:hypothetical protein